MGKFLFVDLNVVVVTAVLESSHNIEPERLLVSVSLFKMMSDIPVPFLPKRYVS
jgi:hypothetical protein